MRSQLGACVISLVNSIKEAFCFVCDFTVFAQSNIYIIYFEAMQSGVRKWAKDEFVQEKGFFCKSWHSSFSEFSFPTTFWMVSCLSRNTPQYFSLFWFRKIQHRHLKCIFYMCIGFYFTIKLTFCQCSTGNVRMWIHLV